MKRLAPSIAFQPSKFLIPRECFLNNTSLSVNRTVEFFAKAKYGVHNEDMNNFNETRFQISVIGLKMLQAHRDVQGLILFN
jgi:hypothetical protein